MQNNLLASSEALNISCSVLFAAKLQNGMTKQPITYV